MSQYMQKKYDLRNISVRDALDTLRNRLNTFQKDFQYRQLPKKYGFYFAKKRIQFYEHIKQRHRKLKIPAWKYALPTNIRHVLSMPFIYSMIVPVVLLDIFTTIYHAVAFPLYRIPKVKRSDYITFDRKYLEYLNIIQKVNCLYCSYVNGFIAYIMEIAARTERYWCPIKASRRMKFQHTWYKDFADYGNPEEWTEKFNNSEAFKGICKES